MEINFGVVVKVVAGAAIVLMAAALTLGIPAASGASAPKVDPGVRITVSHVARAVAAGAPVRYTVAVANTGNVWLVRLAVSDPAAPGCVRRISVLAMRDTYTYRCTVTAPSRGVSHTFTVRGEDATGTRVTDSIAVRIVVAGAVALPATGFDVGFASVLAAALLALGVALVAAASPIDRFL